MVLSSSGAAHQLPHPEKWAEAARTMTRLHPDDFPNLPQPIRVALKRRGCLIPQPYNAQSPRNVIRGAFIRAGQIDWAVLCSRGQTSAILIFRNGSTTSVDEIERFDDSLRLQVVGPQQIGYSREIMVASIDNMRRHNPRGGTAPDVFTHAGIEDTFLEKASIIWYWDGDRWLQLTGAN